MKSELGFTVLVLKYRTRPFTINYYYLKLSSSAGNPGTGGIIHVRDNRMTNDMAKAMCKGLECE